MTTNADYVDYLGAIAAKKAELVKEEERVKDALKKRLKVPLGTTKVVEGHLFRATVVHTEQMKLDMDAVRQQLTPQFIRAHSHGVDQVSVRVVARKGETETKQHRSKAA